MKCYACQITSDDDEWNELSGYFTVTRDAGGYHPPAVTVVTVYICPLCGTLRIREWWLREPEDKEK